MMKFFHPVTTFANTGKSAKGRALQEFFSDLFAMSGRFANFAVRKSMIINLSRRASVNARTYSRAFFMPVLTYISALLGCHIQTFNCSSGATIMGFRERDMTAVSLSISENPKTMKAISVKARPGALIPASIAGSLKTHALHIGVTAGAAAFISTLIGADFFTCVSSFTALLAVMASDKKGGDK